MPAVEIRGLSKWYGKLHALRGVSLRIEEGEFFGYLGPNGAGKTTTINCIVGMSNFQKGNIRVFGKDVAKQPLETKKLIGLAPQEFKFDPFFSIRKLLMYHGGYYGMRGRQLEERVDGMLSMFELDKKEKADVRRLSGGMKRRLQIAKALLHDPPLLILDEPTAGVDIDLRHRLWKYFRQLNEEGKTIILTTHYIEEAERLCDRIGIVDHGRIVALDKKENLLKEKGEQLIKIELYDKIDKLPKSVEKIGKAAIDNKTIVVKCKNARKILPQYLKALGRAGIEVNNVDVIKSRLEDIYLKVTGEEE